MNRRIFWGGFVILIGTTVLLEAMGLINGNIWKYVWALLLILVGIGIMFPDRGN